MNRTFKTRIYPNNKQVTYLNGCCGFSRFAYNRSLAIWNEDYKNGVDAIVADRSAKQDSISKRRFA